VPLIEEKEGSNLLKVVGREWECLYNDPDVRKLRKRSGLIGWQFLAGIPLCGLLHYLAAPYAPFLMGAYLLYPSLQLLTAKAAADNMPEEILVTKRRRQQQQQQRKREDTTEEPLFSFQYLNVLSPEFLFGLKEGQQAGATINIEHFRSSQILQAKPTWISSGVLNDMRLLVTKNSPESADATLATHSKAFILSGDVDLSSFFFFLNVLFRSGVILTDGRWFQGFVSKDAHEAIRTTTTTTTTTTANTKGKSRK